MTAAEALALAAIHRERHPDESGCLSLPRESYDALRADPETPRHLIFTNYGKTLSFDGLEIRVYAPETQEG